MYDAIVLAGGSARRLGGLAKPQLLVDGSSLLDRVVTAAAEARRIVVVGPRQPVARPVEWAREEPPGGGPVAAVAAGLALTTAPVVLVLAADLPWIAPAVTQLVAAVPGGGVAMLRDVDGRANPLAAAWERTALARAIDRLGHTAGAAMHGLTATVTVIYVPDPAGWGRDVDTLDDLRAATGSQGGADPSR